MLDPGLEPSQYLYTAILAVKWSAGAALEVYLRNLLCTDDKARKQVY